MLADIRKSIFSLELTDPFKRSLQREYIDYLRTLLTADYKSSLHLSAYKLSKDGLQPINLSLSDIRPMVRAELKTILGHLPVNGNAMAVAHFEDLRTRIKNALNAQKLTDTQKD